MLPHEPWLMSSTFILSLLGLSFHRTHLISALLCLEGMMLSIFIGIGLWALKTSPLISMIPITVITMSACEAALGLALMVAATRMYGSDNLNSMNLLQC